MSHDIDPGIDGLTSFRRIGSGGFSTVYVAWEAEFSRWVAVKILHDLEEGAARRFERERSLMGQSSGHPNVITPIRSGLTVDGKPFLVMQYMEGGSLQDTIDRGELVPWRDAIFAIRPIADALGDSHQRGILHKDVKPANILLARNGTPSLTDFGIASIRGSTVTQRAFTFAHTAPETFADGNDSRDERSDLYSLASTLFTVIAGRSPFDQEGSDSQLAWITRIATHPVPTLGVSAALDRFLASALAKDPAHRPQNAPSSSRGSTGCWPRGPRRLRFPPSPRLPTPRRPGGPRTPTRKHSTTGRPWPAPPPGPTPIPSPTAGSTPVPGRGLSSGLTATATATATPTLAPPRPSPVCGERHQPRLPPEPRRWASALSWMVAVAALVAAGAAVWFAFLRQPPGPALDSVASSNAASPDDTADPAAPSTAQSTPTEADANGTATPLPPEVQQARLLLGDPDSDVATLVTQGVLPDAGLNQSGFTPTNCEAQLVALQTAFGGPELIQLRDEIAQWPSGAPAGHVDPAGEGRGFRERLDAYVDQTEAGYRACVTEGNIVPVGTHVLSGWASIHAFLCATGTAGQVTLADGTAQPCPPEGDESALCVQILAPLLDDFFTAFPDSRPDPGSTCHAAITNAPSLQALGSGGG